MSDRDPLSDTPPEIGIDAADASDDGPSDVDAASASDRSADAAPYGTRAVAEAELERWPNEDADRDYEIAIRAPEFTCLCPRSGYPDFATIELRYVPDQWIVELRSFKLYINRFREVAISHEAAANRIRDELVELLAPRWLEVRADFNPRGNVHTVVTARYRAEGWQPDPGSPTGAVTGVGRGES